MNTRFQHSGGRRRTYPRGAPEDESLISSIGSFIRFVVVLGVIAVIAVLVFGAWPG